jgi:hypothetical protein
VNLRDAPPLPVSHPAAGLGLVGSALCG